MKMDQLTDKQIWAKAKSGDSSILSDPRVSTLKNEYGETPLHYLAHKGVKEILKHPDVSKVKDEDGWTPLHKLASRGVKEAWSHPDFDKIKNNRGKTPKDVWFVYGYKPITCMDFINNLDRDQKIVI